MKNYLREVIMQPFTFNNIIVKFVDYLKNNYAQHMPAGDKGNTYNMLFKITSRFLILVGGIM